MAIAFIAATDMPSGLNGPVTTGTIDTTGATLLIIAFTCTDGYNETPTDNKSNSWTQLTSYISTDTRVRLWYSVPTTVGAGHDFTIPTGLFVGTMIGVAFSGVSATPADQQNGAGSNLSTTLQPGSITPTENNELIWSHLGINGSGTPISIDSGFTQIGSVNFQSGDHYGASFAYLIQTTAAAVNPTWTRTNSTQMSTTQASFKAAASGPSNVKTWNGVATANIKTINGIAIANVKSVNGVT